MMQVLDSSNIGVSVEHTTVRMKFEDRSASMRKYSIEGRELPSRNDRPILTLLTSSVHELKQKEKVSSSHGDAKYSKFYFLFAQEIPSSCTSK